MTRPTLSLSHGPIDMTMGITQMALKRLQTLACSMQGHGWMGSSPTASRVPPPAEPVWPPALAAHDST